MSFYLITSSPVLVHNMNAMSYSLSHISVLLEDMTGVIKCELFGLFTATVRFHIIIDIVIIIWLHLKLGTSLTCLTINMMQV